MSVDLPEVCAGSPRLLEMVLASLSQGVALLDSGGEITYANPALENMLGYRESGLRMLHLSRLLMPDDQTYLLTNLLRLVDAGRAFSGEIMLRRADGSGLHAEMAMLSLSTDSGRDVVCLYADDIGERKRMAGMMGGAQFGDLLTIANGIAHELRNPLAGIGGFVRRLYNACQISPQGDQYYRYIVDNLQRIEHLVRKVRDLVSLPPPVYEKLELREAVSRGMEPLRGRMESAGIELIVSCPTADLFGDRDQLARAFAILAENAIDAQPGGGRIDIQADTGNGRCHVRVSDAGPGIDQSVLPLLFAPFVSSKAAGVGIDLAVLRRIVESHGGSVSARNLPGAGACFEMDLPLERRRPIRTRLLEL